MSIVKLINTIKEKESSLAVCLEGNGPDYVKSLGNSVAAVIAEPGSYISNGVDGLITMKSALETAANNGIYSIVDCRKFMFSPSAIMDGMWADGYIVREHAERDELQTFMFESNKKSKTIFCSFCQQNYIVELSGQGFSETGYSSMGILTSLYFLEDIRSLRKRLPMSFFLIQNYKEISQKLAVVRSHFKSDCTGALVISNCITPTRAETLRRSINKTVFGGILR